jgi:hypothetical protein
MLELALMGEELACADLADSSQEESFSSNASTRLSLRPRTQSSFLPTKLDGHGLDGQVGCVDRRLPGRAKRLDECEAQEGS